MDEQHLAELKTLNGNLRSLVTVIGDQGRFAYNRHEQIKGEMHTLRNVVALAGGVSMFCLIILTVALT